VNKLIAVSSLAAFVALSAPALADHGDHGGHGGDHHGGGGGDHNAPEPMTVIGLALGAGGVAAARWKASRNGSKKH
jgi:hypothetical protein